MTTDNNIRPGDIAHRVLASGKFSDLAVYVFGRLFVVSDRAGRLCAVGTYHNSGRFADSNRSRPLVMMSLASRMQGDPR